MAHDFAKKHQRKSSGASRKKSRQQNDSMGSNWSWFFSGLVTGVFAVFAGYYLVQHSISELPAEDSSATTQTALEDTNDDGPVFDFYRYLPQAEVAVDVVPVEISPAEEDEPLKQYMLQAGSFQERQDAENRLAKIILLNLDARIVPGIVSGKTWHRVQVGPFAGRRNVEAARDKLSLSNIDSIVLQLR